jgi:hypothetical protein
VHRTNHISKFQNVVIPQNFLFAAQRRKKIYAESHLVGFGKYQTGFQIKSHFPAFRQEKAIFPE